MAIQIGDWRDNALTSKPNEANRLNGFGVDNLGLAQRDILVGNNSNLHRDTFVLGGTWGVSYHDDLGWGRDGYALIRNWNPNVDRIEAFLSNTVTRKSYSVDKSRNIVGGGVPDTQIFYTSPSGQRELVAVIQDSIGFNLANPNHFTAANLALNQDGSATAEGASDGDRIKYWFTLVEGSNYDLEKRRFKNAVKNFSEITNGSSEFELYKTRSIEGYGDFIIADSKYSPDGPTTPTADLKATIVTSGSNRILEYQIVLPEAPDTLLTSYKIPLKDSGIDESRALIDIKYIISQNLLSRAVKDDVLLITSLAQIGGVENDTITGGTTSNYINGFGLRASATSQFDRLTGGAGGDIFVLGGGWGVSYFEKGDGYALITDWRKRYGSSDSVADRLEVLSTQTLGGGEYFARKRAVGGIGNGSQDTEIFYRTTGGKVDRIAILQDTTDFDLNRDLIEVSGYKLGFSRYNLLTGGAWDDVLVGSSSANYINGFGTASSQLSQFDSLTGGGGADTFILGGKWGISYFEKGDGYAIIKDWNPGEGDRISALDPSKFGLDGQYLIEKKSVSSIGTGAIDTEIYFRTGNGQKERIAIIQDSTNFDLTNTAQFHLMNGASDEFRAYLS